MKKVHGSMNTKKIVALVAIALCSTVAVKAQTYLDYVKQSNTGKAKVTVTQSKEIDVLVNGKGGGMPVAKTTGQQVQDKGKAAVKTPADLSVGVPTTTELGKSREGVAGIEAARREAEARRLAEMKGKEAERKEKTEGDMESPMVDMRKKVMRGSRKVTGYRVQAFAGGNTRSDKQQAQEIGNAIKMKFPDQPIYVHFYSPRWICRIGNFRSYQEAERVLKQVRAMGYRAATIVKGQITVQY